jgi:hypothetical protein
LSATIHDSRAIAGGNPFATAGRRYPDGMQIACLLTVIEQVDWLAVRSEACGGGKPTELLLTMVYKE